VVVVVEEELADVGEGVGPLLGRGPHRVLGAVGGGGGPQRGSHDHAQVGLEGPGEVGAALEGA
jgi:hypothetical protein